MDLLKELFPNVKEQKLQLTLDSAQGDLELATSMVLSELSCVNDKEEDGSRCSSNSSNDTDEQPNHLHEVKEMFPDIDVETVEKVFKQEKAMIPNVITHLLNLEYLKNESLEDDSDGNIESVHSEIIPSSWNNTRGDVGMVAHLLRWPEDYSVVTQQYQENHFNPRRTVVSMILNEVHPKLVHTPTVTVNKHNFNRVQANRGFAHKTTQGPGRDAVPSLLSSSGKNNNKKDNTTNKFLACYNEFLTLIKQDKECQGINPQFVLKLFQYFQEPDESLKKTDLSTIKTDLESCFEVLSYVLAAHNGIALTFNRELDEKSWNVVSNKKNKNENMIIDSNNYTAYMKKSKYNTTINSSSKIPIEVCDVFQTFKMDFHGYTPQQAVNTLNRIITSWWHEELKQRELNNINLQKQNVACLEPLKVITGRGIHSIGGKSPVRYQVKRYLDLNNYIYNEEPSYFEVHGKKRGK